MLKKIFFDFQFVASWRSHKSRGWMLTTQPLQPFIFSGSKTLELNPAMLHCAVIVDGNRLQTPPTQTLSHDPA